MCTQWSGILQPVWKPGPGQSGCPLRLGADSGHFTPQNSSGVRFHVPITVAHPQAPGDRGPYSNLGEGEGLLCSPHIRGALAIGPSGQIHKPCRPCWMGGPTPAPWWALPSLGPGFPSMPPTEERVPPGGLVSPSTPCGTCVLSSAMGAFRHPHDPFPFGGSGHPAPWLAGPTTLPQASAWPT